MPKRGERMPDDQRARLSASLRAKGRVGDTKHCPGCDTTKPRTEFGVRKNGHSRSYCRGCERVATARWHRANPEASADGQRRGDLRRRFALTSDEFDALHTAQDGRCAICGDDTGRINTSRLFIDHCHDQSRVRGLLCGRCNTGIGMFADDPDRLRAAIAYLAAPPAYAVLGR